MIVDVFLPSVLFLIAMIAIFLYSRLDKKVNYLVGGKELRPKHAILLVAAIGTMVTVIIAIPQHALLGLFLFAYTAILFLFTYLIVSKWYLAAVPAVLFILSFFYFWNIYTFNLFAILFGIAIAVYMGVLFTWKTTVAFAALVTIMDIIQVLITGHMEGAFETAQKLGIPAFIKLPTFPTMGTTYLGLGDIFLFGLLSIQNTRKYGKKFGLNSTILMTIVYLLLQTVLLNYVPLTNGFPATVLVVSGWLTSLAARYIYNSFISKKEKVTTGVI
ncbi:MAG: hypothetical protein JSW14_00695 [Candidatus Bathyarchaeum sp.]|nr:MAG: hypothetical protein JSW14_00695 [Candidatus Bathyarchaeum sp.]